MKNFFGVFLIHKSIPQKFLSINSSDRKIQIFLINPNHFSNQPILNQHYHIRIKKLIKIIFSILYDNSFITLSKI